MCGIFISRFSELEFSRCFAGIELVSETTVAERTSATGVQPDLVQGIEFAYTLPASDLVVLLLWYFLFYTLAAKLNTMKMTSLSQNALHVKSYFEPQHVVL